MGQTVRQQRAVAQAGQHVVRGGVAECLDLAVQVEVLADVLRQVVEQTKPLFVQVDPRLIEDAERSDGDAGVGSAGVAAKNRTASLPITFGLSR
jgi:hypothetical protein